MRWRDVRSAPRRCTYKGVALDSLRRGTLKRKVAHSETPGRKNGQAVRLHDCWNFNTIFSPQATREARYLRTLIRAARGFGAERFLFGQKRRLPATDQKFPGLFLLPGGGEHQTVVDRNGGITQLIATQAVHGI